MPESASEVFEALLREYEVDERELSQMYAEDQAGAEQKLQQRLDEWRERFRAAL
jgi:hypothetical protein